VSVWFTADRLVVTSPEMTPAASAATWLTAPPCDSDSADHQWSARQRHSLSTTESGWSAQPQSVELTSVSRREASSAIRLRGVSTRPASHRSPHLHDTPLL